MMERFAMVFSACLLEAAFGYPEWLYRVIKHPVVWMGTGIAFFERYFNRPSFSRRPAGICAMALLLALVTAASLILRHGGILLETFAMAALMAQRSLYTHVHDVYDALKQGDLEDGRRKLSRIVGRDTEALDKAGVCRAAIESLAESFSDGVIAPLFWGLLLGLPGIACYKAINTADSMIGHKNARYRQFGWAAARLDDAANFIPARLSGLLLVIASRSPDAWRVMRRDARNHASPNAGWPEAAMAGALRLQFGGTRYYEGVEIAAPLIGEGTGNATPAHLQRALRLYLIACFMPLLALALLWTAAGQ
ncbi:MAG: cobalamin biosynthesis protein CobD [Pseudomonadota bacterium]|nr:cobalamin biosynthesis protein CobD [Pseudomonadota bacterium]